MIIASIIPNIFSKRAIYNNSRFDYSQNRRTLLSSPEGDCFIKTPSFQGKKKKSNSNNYFSESKNPNDVYPSRKPLESLYQYDPPCFCCGRRMINPAEIQKLKDSKALQCKAPQAVQLLSKYKSRMHTTEKEVFEILEEQAKLHPDMDFRQILQLIKPEPEAKLVKTQLGIFTLIEKASENIKPEQKKQIKELIQTETTKILMGDNQFRRKHFVDKFEQIFKDSKNTATKEHLIRLATKLPTSYEDKNAFIVKYCNRPPETIALRLISYSMDTIEHLRPKNKGGENHLFNYVPECMRCNSFRQDRPMRQQLEEHPEMFYNAQKLTDWLIDYANNGQLSKWYIIKMKQRVYEESDKLLNLDISALQMNKKMLKEYSKMEIEPTEVQIGKTKKKKDYTSSKAKKLANKSPEIKKTKKEKKAEKLKKQHNKISSQKKEETQRI